ncbi:helix-turn-helix domain-containing protein [Capsulimonas corticalis]|uniref:helix-turn-helix domain-containing protein n=1 Tax=Capsulimonas corticalis TaxID=2219043 RepID=UPI00262D3E2D|nr:AraC family transcriptional regulator [Capsulimonas corticalis]
MDAGHLISRGKRRHPDRIWNSFLLIYVASGVLSIQEGETPFTVSAGETLLLWPGRRHFGREDYPKDLTFFWLHFDCPDAAPGLEAQPLTVSQHVRVARPEKLAEMFRWFLDDQENGVRSQLAADLVATLILCESARALEDLKDDDAPRSPLAGQAREYIRTHFRERLSASVVSHAMSVNTNYLSRIYKRSFGKTMTEEINTCRMALARVKLLENKETVDCIAREVGYHDVVYFRRVFQRSHGMTPRAYQRAFSHDNVVSY